MLAPLFAAALTLTINKSHPVARFDPSKSIGATIDAEEHGATDEVLTRRNVAAMLSAGFHPLSYRLATELGGEAWHWNPRGSWSDATHHEGYWTSSADSSDPRVPFAYPTTRSGATSSWPWIWYTSSRRNTRLTARMRGGDAGIIVANFLHVIRPRGFRHQRRDHADRASRTSYPSGPLSHILGPRQAKT